MTDVEQFAGAKAPWEDKYWTSRDGLKLYYRDYAGPSDRPPLLMLHGLTRNSRDFELLAEHYAGDWRVIAVDFRGRGRSQYDPNSANYQPPIYSMDVLQLLDEIGVERAVFMGTSLGGLVTMIVATVAPDRIAGVLLNDVGPELNLVGIDRIKSYVGRPVVFRDRDEAIAELRDRHRNVHPGYSDAQWEAYTHRVLREADGGLEFDYDMRIAEPFDAANSGEAPDIWPYYRAFAGKPVLVVRGEHSDLLTDAALERMATEIPDVEAITVPGVGHAPDLTEPEAVAAIDRLLERVLKR